MEQFKIISSNAKEAEIKPGQVCPLPGAGGIGSAKGAMGSAIVTLVL